MEWDWEAVAICYLPAMKLSIGRIRIEVSILCTRLHANRTGEVVVLLATGFVEAEPHLNLLLVISAAVGVPEA